MPRDETHARGNADGGGCDGLRKANTGIGECVEVGRVDCCISSAAQGICALLVGHEDENIGAIRHGVFLSSTNQRKYLGGGAGFVYELA